MKIKFIFTAILATMALASCQKDELGENNGSNKEKGTFDVSLPGAPDTYAVENPQSAGVIKPFYNDVTVFLVDAGNNVSSYEWTEAEIAAKMKRFEQITEPSKVIVVANKYATNLTATNTTELTAKLATLAIADQNKAALNIPAADGKGNVGDYVSVQQVTLYGEQTTLTDETADDGHTLKKAAVELASLVSRFEVGTVKPGVGLKSLTVENVYINYFYNDYGMTDGNSQKFTEFTWPADFTPAWATDVANAGVTSADGTKAYAYQVFTGNMVPHIIYKLSGEVAAGYKLADGTEGEFTGKYITVSGFKVGAATLAPSNAIASANIYPMKAHEIYKMGLTGGGIEINVDQITDKPEKGKQDLIVAITVAPWTTQEVTPEI